MPFDNTPQPYESNCTRNLKTARALIAHYDDWTQGEMIARGGARCSVGALLPFVPAAARRGGTSPEIRLLAAQTRGMAWWAPALAMILVFKRPSRMRVMLFNDNHRHSVVMGMWDRAIAASEALDRQKARACV